MKIITKRFSVEYNALTDSHYVVTIINEGESREIHTAGLTFTQALYKADSLEEVEAIGKDRIYCINERTRGDLSAGTIGRIIGYMGSWAMFAPQADRVEMLPAEWLDRLEKKGGLYMKNADYTAYYEEKFQISKRQVMEPGDLLEVVQSGAHGFLIGDVVTFIRYTDDKRPRFRCRGRDIDGSISEYVLNPSEVTAIKKM